MPGDPLWINVNAGAPSYTANELRQAHALPFMYGGRLLGARQGVRPGGTQLKVTLVTTTITIDTGVALIDPGLTTPQGPYWVALPAQETQTLTAADATNPRKDIVILRVYDNDEDASGLRTARSEYIAGTPAASPTEPATPAGSLKLARIDVPQSGGGAAVVTDTRVYVASPGGLLSIADATERGTLTPYDSLAVYRRDRDWVEIYDGAAWRVQGVAIVTSSGDLSTITSPYAGQIASDGTNGARYVYDGAAWKIFSQNGWTTYAVTWTAATTNPVLNNGTLTGKYRYLDPGTVQVDIRLKPGSTTTFGSGQYQFLLPVSTATGEDPFILGSAIVGGSIYRLFGYANTDSGGQGTLLMATSLTSQNNIGSWTLTSPFTFASGNTVQVAGIYRV